MTKEENKCEQCPRRNDKTEHSKCDCYTPTKEEIIRMVIEEDR